MKITAIVLVLTLALMSSGAFAKRTLPPKIEPVVYEGVRYCAPNDNGRVAHVDAYDVKTGEKLWQKKIFENAINLSLEEDVQWIFIKSMEIAKGNLMVVDERENRYLLDLKSLEVKKLKK